VSLLGIVLRQRRLSADAADSTRWAAALTSLKLEAGGPIQPVALMLRT
jgi:hypothetical protein